MATDPLFESLKVGDIVTPHRVWMSPLTRSRAQQPGNVPWALNAEYYRQRAGAGLIISEATQISPQGQGYAYTPGIHSAEQVEGWKAVTGAVHAEGGKIVLQLWHVGRISHPDLQPGGQLPVAPSAIAPKGGKTYTSHDSGFIDIPTPRALEADELPAIVADYGRAAENAKKAGFDGVELHGANGYLIDQFLRDGTNHRTDEYGGSVENRLRFPLQVVEKLVDVWGGGRVAIRISPTGKFNDMEDSDPKNTFTAFARELNRFGLAFLEVVEHFGPAAPHPDNDAIMASLRETFEGPYIANGDYTAGRAREAIANGQADAVTFGRLYIANPDLAERFKVGAPLNEPDQSTFYGGNEKGYTDYPFLAERTTSPSAV